MFHTKLVLAVLGTSLAGALAFESVAGKNSFSFALPLTRSKAGVVCFMSADTDQTAAVTTGIVTNTLRVPVTFDEMIRETTKAMTDAYEKGITRQMLRLLMPRDPTSQDLGMMFEGDADFTTSDLILYPVDESWQGGIMQLYRAAAPTCQAILKRFSKNEGGIPPRMVEDRSIDESGVDGIGLWMSQNVSPADDVSCFVQPTQETIDAIERISSQAGKRLVSILNPQWRNVDDALDTASKESGFLGSLASFLGGKGNSLKRLDDLGYQNVFTVEGYVCKGGNIRLVKRFDSDWAVFAENDSATDYIKVGTSKNRPTYQDCDKMLEDMGIGVKYARDIGLAPKFERRD